MIRELADFAANYWLTIRHLLPVLLGIALLTLVALILDATLSNDGKW